MGETAPKKTIVCIPGLGGHESSLKDYKNLLREYDLKFLRLVEPEKALEDLLEICKNEKEVVLFANCYGAELALRAIPKLRGVITHLIVVEPFFIELNWWGPLALIANKIILTLLEFARALGLGRGEIQYNVDYTQFAKYPIFFQPFYDIRWQHAHDYFLKIDDILRFRLPSQVDVPTLFLVSPRGYQHAPTKRKKLSTIFINSDIITVKARTHNIISLASDEIAGLIRGRLIEHAPL